jgi:hypothetical protein
MHTLAETGAPHRWLARATWLAAALAATASLLHWVTTSTDTHSWTGEAVVSLVAGAGLMLLALTLAARIWSTGTARTIYLAGAVGTALVVIALLLPVLSEATSGHTGGPGHVGHDVGEDEVMVAAAVARTTVEVTLVGLLAWMHRVSGRDEPGLTGVAG